MLEKKREAVLKLPLDERVRLAQESWTSFQPAAAGSRYRVLETHSSSAEALAAGIIEGVTVQLGLQSKSEAPPDHTIHIITANTEAHEE